MTGLCSYLAAKSEADHYARELRREQEEILSVPDIGNYIFFSPNFQIIVEEIKLNLLINISLALYFMCSGDFRSG